jgi:O-antigen/teichoic acid export membrane protein
VIPSTIVADELKKLLRQSSHYLFGLVGSLALGFVSFPIFTRIFTVADYGLIDFVQRILLLATAGAKAGMQNSALRFYDARAFKGDSKAASRYYSTMLLGAGAIGILITLVFAFSIGRFPKIVDPPLATVLSFASLLIVLRALQSILSSFLRIEERTKTYNVLGVVTKAGMIAAVCALLPWMGATVKTYYAGTMVVELTIAAILIGSLTRRDLLSLGSFDSSLFRAGFAFGLPLIVQELAGIILDSGDRALVRAYLGANPLGLYSVAYGLASYVNNLLIIPLSLAILPIYMRLWNSEGREMTIQFVSVSFDAFLVAAFGLLAIASVSARDGVALMASAKYRGADALIPPLVAGLLVYAMQVFLNAGLLIEKKTVTMAAVFAISALLNIGLNVILLPRVGLQGAAVATLISYLFCTALLTWISFRVLPLNIQWKPVIGYGVAAAVAWMGGSAVETGFPLLNLMLKPTIALTSYVSLLLLIDQRVRDLSSRLWRMLRDRMESTPAVVA